MHALFSKQHVSYQRCGDCALVRQHPQPSRDKLLATYDNGAAYFLDRARSVDYKHGEAWLQKTAGFYAAVLTESVPCYERDTLDILDVGAATGVLVKQFQDAGHRALGVELSTWAAGYGRDNYHVEMLEGDLLHADLAERRFDVVSSRRGLFVPYGRPRELRRLMVLGARKLVWSTGARRHGPGDDTQPPDWTGKTRCHTGRDGLILVARKRGCAA